MPTDVDVRLASALVFDGERPLHWDGEGVSSFIAFLRANRVPVASLPRAPVLAASEPSGTFRDYVREEVERQERRLSAYLEVAAAWANEGIEGVLIKSPGYFPYTSSNVDVLVSNTRAIEACKILANLGYSELPLFREPYKRLFRRRHEPYLGFPIHVHTAVAWINLFLSGADVLEGRRRSGDIELLLYPSPDNVFLITTAHWLYEDKTLTLRDLYHAALAVRDGVAWDAVRSRAGSAGWRDALEFALALYGVAADRFSARDLHATLPRPEVRGRLLGHELERVARRPAPPVRLSKPLWKGLHLAKTAADPGLSPRAMVRELSLVVFFAFQTKLPSVRNGPVVVVSLSGPDGAGKTTLARALQAFLEHEVGVATSYHWLRVGTSTWLDFGRSAAASVLRAAARDGRAAEAAHMSPGQRKMLLQGRPRLGWGWSYVLLADFLVRLWAKRMWCGLVGGIHIFDRYAIDAAVDLRVMYGFDNARLAAELAPSATVQIVIDVPGDHERLQSPSSPVPQEPLSLSELYGRYGAGADAVLAAREPIDSMLNGTARLVVTSLIKSSGAEIS